jgi:hypothetical protein
MSSISHTSARTGGQRYAKRVYVVHTRYVASRYVHNLAEGCMKSLRKHDGTHIPLVGHWRTFKSGLGAS